MNNRTYYIRSYYSHIISTNLTDQLVTTGEKPNKKK